MNIRMEIIYKTSKGVEVRFSSDEMKMEKAILIAEDMEKTGRLKEVTFIDVQDRTWSLKELKKFLEGIQTEPHHISVYFDGGFDAKSKKSGLGCVIYYEQDGKHFRKRKNAFVEEIETNNEAEYAALYLGLQELEALGVHHLPVKFVGDSQVVINQLSGEWPCYEETLTKWADRVEDKMKQMGIHPEYEAISRKQNREADHLASQALEGLEIASNIQL
ncbi:MULTISPECIES: ribonuclease H family protein [Bacillaceae]|uniref:RNase H type-1 domain-containing protein n=1 Tax=Oceanobacillus caeni TaxID=405946 RepID=A0ABR5MFM7_9BACI|nr:MULTISPECIES: ribonuclease H family protein [Bacillaceae]KPH69431.1 hypothetical protein AFL42_17095 [Oceanobacillus caeni]MED4475885.1 ribonuclease H family protein [Oceanobacillus caeni]